LSLSGSVLRNDFTAESDVDVLVEFRPEARIGFIEHSRLQRNLTELLGRNVDLVPKRGLKPVIRDEVPGSARVIFTAILATEFP
jgi:predicted nucleotidyltransferase